MTDPNGNGNDTPPKVVFTPEQQEELNRIVGERVARAESKYADYDTMKAEVDELKQTLDSKDATIQEKEEAVATFQQAQSVWEEEKTTRDLKDKVLEAGEAAGFRHREDAYALLDLAEVTEDPEKISDLVKALAEKRPELLGKLIPGTGTTHPKKASDEEQETREEKLARLGMRTGVSVWEGASGGGVLFPPSEEE